MHKLTIRGFEYSDFPLIESWYTDRGLEIPTRDLVAPTGLMIMHENTPILAGFLIKTDCRVAIFQNYISDPKSEKEIRSEAISLLTEALLGIAKKWEAIYTCCSTEYPSIIKQFEKHDFVKDNKNYKNLGRFLWHGCP